mgnify:CR=1 FL=1
MTFRFVGLFAAVTLLAVAALPVPGQAQQPQPSQQPQENRIALVIGNGAYAKAPLATAANDAGLVAQTLQAAGFDVIGARDLGGDTLRGSFRDFIQKAEASGPDTVAMIYLSGYGVQLAGENYFIPVDSKIERDTDIPTEGLRLGDYIRQLAALPLKAGIVVLDIARQQPFIEGGSIASGLALVEPVPKMLIAYNAAPGTVAPEEQGSYGAYAQALAEMIRAGGLPLSELFDRVRLRVNETTKGAQVPWDAAKVEVPFVFFDRASDAPPQATPAQTQAARDKPVKDMGAADAYAAVLERDTLQGYEDFLSAYPHDPMAKRVRVIVAARREAVTWRRTYRTDTPDAYWSYLRRYPHGPHAADARRRLAVLSAALEPPPSFAMIDYDVPPPPPDEIVYVDRPVLMFSDPDFDFAPPPPPPVYYLPPPPEDFIDLPPPYYSDELFILPQPIFVPIPIFVRPPVYVRPPQHNVIFANIHNRAVIDNEINRHGPGGFNRPGPNGQGIFPPGTKGPAGQRPSPQFNAGTTLPGAVQRRATLIQEGKAPRPASSFINPRANAGNIGRHAPLPGPRKFGPAANTPPAAPGARTMTPATMPSRNTLPVPGRGNVPNAPAARGPQPIAPSPQTSPGGPGVPKAGGPGAGGAGHMAPGPDRRGSDGRGRGPDAVKPPPSARPSPPPASMRPAPQVQRPVAPSRPAPQVRPQPQPRMAPPPRHAAPPQRMAPPPRMTPQRPPPMARPAAPPRPAPAARPAPPPRAAPPRAAPPPPRAAPPRPAPSRPAPAKRCPPNAPRC